MSNPRAEQRLWVGLIAFGGVLAGCGVLVRDITDGGNDQWTFLFDTIGLIVALLGGCLDFRTTLKYGEYDVAAARRRGTILVLVGLVLGVGGCWMVGWVLDTGTPPLLRAALSGAMTAGIAAGIGGLLHIGWFSSGDHIERRIAQRAEEEW